MDESDKSAGGFGGPPSIRETSVRDTRLIERAIREHWNIPEKWRTPLLERQYKIATDESIEPREATSAFKAILAANGQNLQQEALALKEREVAKPATPASVTQIRIVQVNQIGRAPDAPLPR